MGVFHIAHQVRAAGFFSIGNPALDLNSYSTVLYCPLRKVLAILLEICPKGPQIALLIHSWVPAENRL